MTTSISKPPITEQVKAAYDQVKGFPENQPDGFIRLIELRNLMPDMLDHVAKLEAKISELEKKWVTIPRLTLGPIPTSSHDLPIK